MKYLISSILFILVMLLTGCPTDHGTGSSSADRNLFFNTLAVSGYDLQIIDYSQNGDDASAFTRGDIDLMKTRGSCLVAVNISLGVAETNRFYWHNEWDSDGNGYPDSSAPSWVIQRAMAGTTYNKWYVKFWDPAWKQIMFGRDSSYLSRILQAGYSGVYLTGLDKWQYTGNPRADSAMRALIMEFTDTVKARRPNMFVIAQNLGTLSSFPDLVVTLDGAAQDEMYWGYGRSDGNRTPDNVRSAHYASLSPFGLAGKQMFAIDYPFSSSPDEAYYGDGPMQQISDGRNLALGAGLKYYPAPRNLNDLTIIPGAEPTQNTTPILVLGQVREFCIYLRPGPH